MATLCEDAPTSIRLRNLTCLKDFHSAVQHLQYYRSDLFGRVLVIDGEIQHVEAWAPLYHETIVHLPCSFIPSVKRCLILGGGDLLVAQEVLKYNSVKAVYLVDFDPCVTQATLDVYENAAATVADPRLKIIDSKAEDYLASCVDAFDLIINDAVDLAYVNSASTDDLYQEISRLLTEDGICSDLIYRSIYDDERFTPAMRKVKEQAHKAVSLVCVPEYPGIFHLLTMWGRNSRLSQDCSEVRNIHHGGMGLNGSFRYYDPRFLSYYLYTPPYVREYIK
jgi:spermidine synthase